MIPKVPQKPSSTTPRDLDEMARRLFVFGGEAQEYMRQLPTIEARSFISDDSYPLYVQTETSRPWGVIRVGTFEVDQPSETIGDTGINWRPSDDPSKPGIVVTNLDGLTAGTSYEIRVIILGLRQ